MMEKEANISLDKTKEHVFLKTFVAGGNWSMYIWAAKTIYARIKLFTSF